MRSSKPTSQRIKPYADPVGKIARVLERHEAKIARHTALQSAIAGWQLFIGTITTAALIYVAYQQYNASDRQVALEYAKVAPQFQVTQTFFPTKTSEAVPAPFPKGLTIRIARGEASLESVTAVQELEIPRLVIRGTADGTCVLRLANYFLPSAGNQTDFAVPGNWRKVAAEPSWFQDSGYRDFVLIRPRNTLVTIRFRDIFGKSREAKFAGANGRLEQIPSGDFSRSTIYETVAANVRGSNLQVPGSFGLSAKKQPVTRACRSMFGLAGGKESIYE